MLTFNIGGIMENDGYGAHVVGLYAARVHVHCEETLKRAHMNRKYGRHPYAYAFQKEAKVETEKMVTLTSAGIYYAYWKIVSWCIGYLYSPKIIFPNS